MCEHYVYNMIEKGWKPFSRVGWGTSVSLILFRDEVQQWCEAYLYSKAVGTRGQGAIRPPRILLEQKQTLDL